MPDERRAEFERTLHFLREHVPAGYEEAVTPKAIVFQTPLGSYARRGRPLWYVALSSEKSYMSLHVMPVYASADLLTQLNEGYTSAGKTLNMGKACIRFRNVDDLELGVLARIVSSIAPERWVEIAESAFER